MSDIGTIEVIEKDGLYFLQLTYKPSKNLGYYLGKKQRIIPQYLMAKDIGTLSIHLKINKHKLAKIVLKNKGNFNTHGEIYFKTEQDAINAKDDIYAIALIKELRGEYKSS